MSQYTITNGVTTQGELFSKDIAGEMQFIIDALAHGNSPIMQLANPTNAYMDTFIKEVPAKLGQRVPVETFNIRWSEGGLVSDAPQFNVYRSHFKLKKQSFKILGFKHEIEDVRKAKSSGVNLLAQDAENVTRARNNYMNTFLPTVKIQTLISGDSSSTSLPVLNNGGSYADQIGLLRGEDCSDILQPYVANKNVNMLRAKKSSALSAEDVFDIVQSLRDFTTNAGCIVEGLGSPRSIWALKQTLSYEKNIDTATADGIPAQKIATVNFVEINGLPDGFLFFIARTADPIIFKAVDSNEDNRGLQLVGLQGVSNIKDASALNGAYLEIAEFGMHLLKREAVGILDITTANGTGLMTSTGVTTLETFLSTVRNGILMNY